VPAIAAVALVRAGGFLTEAEYPLGPVHAYVAPPIVFDVKVIVPPAHTAEGVALPLIIGVGDAGVAFTTTDAVPAGLEQPFDVTIKLYVPAMAVVAPAIIGF
jgi:hypothetical protein